MSTRIFETVTASGDAVGPMIRVRRAAPVDLVHLARQTFGSAELEAEILRLFVGQSRDLAKAIAAAAPAERAALLHRLKGSAHGVGAERVALAVEALETPELAESEVRRLVCDLEDAVAEVRLFVGSIL